MKINKNIWTGKNKPYNRNSLYFPNGIDLDGESGESGGGTMEYLDLSGVDRSVKVAVGQYAVYVKAILEKYNGKVTGVPLYVIESLVDDPFEAISAIAIDFASEVLQEMGGSSVRTSTAESVLLYGTTQADIDAIPRITKEQFYDLNA